MDDTRLKKNFKKIIVRPNIRQYSPVCLEIGHFVVYITNYKRVINGVSLDFSDFVCYNYSIKEIEKGSQ
jgi:hypothetical protein